MWSVISLWFWFLCLIISDVERLLYTCWKVYVFFLKMSIQISCPFLVDFLMYDVQFHSFHITSLPSFPNIIYWKDYPVLIVYSCLLCHKSIGHISMGLFWGSLLCSIWASLVAQLLKNPPAMRDTWVQSLGWEDHLEKAMATHSQPTPVFWPGEFHGLCSP